MNLVATVLFDRLASTAAAWGAAAYNATMIVWLLAVGGSVGSFINVVVYRLPRGESLWRPASRCPACRTPLSLRENLPVVGWLWLGGRCRTCGVNISARYPTVELLLALVFATLGWCGPLSRGANLPRVGSLPLPDYLSGWPEAASWLTLGYHGALAALLTAIALWELDGRRVPPRWSMVALGVGWLAPVAWPGLRPVAAAAPVLQLEGGYRALADGVAGLFVATWLASMLRPCIDQFDPRRSGGHFAEALACMGLFLGWQAATALSGLGIAVWLVGLAAADLFGRRPWPPAAAALATATWLWLLLWRPLVERLSWLGT